MATNFTIKVIHNDVEKAIRRMKKKLTKTGLMRELRLRKNYEKGSDKRIRKQKEMIANTRRKMRKLNKEKGLLNVKRKY